ncbi:hypothetical protein TSUD_115790 [Trifolium subterraneum]|uniref:Gnk2-homologous domain-containing protein n=1 Tax=Trifolium subterraneum TaxID=3900 RepID=A0A2Z6LZU8_TRISU|nr:hypothetical protein TSUD_115790 [Trifolium subterraneum]
MITILFSLLYLTLAIQASPTYIGSYCNDNTTYLPNTTLDTNINVLLNSLTTNASQQDSGYYMTIMGFGTNSAINGEFLCRGDINTTICQNCVTDAAKQIKRRCNNQTEAVIWYEECLIRYTNKYFKFYSIEPRLNPRDGRNVSGVDFDRFNNSVIGLLNGLAVKAANSETAKKFATGEVEITRRGTTVYGSGQCMTDLSNGCWCYACVLYC